MRTFADWNDPAPGSMEMDLVAHCGPVNRGSYVNSLVLTDIANNAATIKVALLRMAPDSPAPLKSADLLFKQLTMQSESPKITVRAQPKGQDCPPKGFPEGSLSF